MNYTDLLAQQEAEREQLHVARKTEHEKLLALQKVSPVPERFEPEKQNLYNHYVELERSMNKRHDQERKAIIPEQEVTSKKPEKDITEEAAQLLEKYRKRQQERKGRGIEPEP